MTYEVQPLDLMQYINTKYHEAVIREYIEFDSPIDESRLKTAVAQLIKRYPLLNCVYDSQKNVFTEKKTLDINEYFVKTEETDRDKFLSELIDIDKSLVRFTLSENCLYVTISHLVCDGGGFKQLLYLICDVYNHGADGKDLNYLMNRDFDRLTEKFSPSEKRKMTVKMLASMMGNYKNRPVYEKSDNQSEFCVTRTIDEKKMTSVHKLTKSKGATLNDVFLTAYARAINKNFGLNKINIPCTVDLRKYAEKPIGIGNLTGTYSCNVKIKSGEDFSTTLSKVSARMQKQKKTRNDIAGPNLLVSKYKKSTLEKFLKLYGNMNTSAFTDYTNLGITDEKKLAFDGVKVKNAVMFGCNNKAPCFQLAVSSFRGETTLSGIFICGEKQKKTVDSLFDTVVEEIISFT